MEPSFSVPSDSFCFNSAAFARTTLCKEGVSRLRFLQPLRTTFPRLTIALSCLLVSTPLIVPYTAQSAPAPSSLPDHGSYGPIVQIISPELGDVIKDVHPIRIAITPRKYPAQSVELLVDGHAVSGVLAAQTQFKWDTKLFVDGPHTLGVRVTDTQGFIGQTEITVYINNKRGSGSGTSSGSSSSAPADNLPVLRWLGIEDGQNLSGSKRIALETGGDFRIKYMFLNLNSAISPDVKPPLASWMTNRAPYEFSLDTTRYKDGLYVLDAYAWDAMENERNAPRLTIGIFNKSTPPAPAQSEVTESEVAEKNEKKKEESSGKADSAKPAVKALAQNTPAAAPQSTFTPPAAPAPAATLAARDTTSAAGARQTAPQTEASEPREVFASHSFQQRTTTLSSAQITKPSAPEAAPKSSPALASSSNAAAAPKVAAPAPAATAAPSQPKPAPAASSRVASAPSSATTQAQPSRVAAAPTAAPAPKVAPGVSLAPQTQHPPASQSESLQSSSRIASATQARSTAPEGAPRFSAAPQKVQTSKPAVSQVEKRAVSEQIASASDAISTAQNPIVTPTAPRLARIEAPRPASAPQVLVPANSAKTAYSSASTSSASTSVVAQTTASLRSAPAPVEASRADRVISPRLAAAPRFVEPKASATAAPSSVRAQLSAAAPSSATPGTRIAFAAPQTSLLRIASTHAMPTAPRLAFSPSFSKPAPAATPAQKAAIVVAPSPYAPTSHIVQQNETLSSIAARYKMPASAIATANGLKPNAPIARGTNLLLPQGLLISYKGQAVTSDVAPLLIGSVSVAPFRFLFEKQGGTMDWDAANQRVIARNGDHEISLKIGSKTALVNQQEVMMDMAAFLLSGRTMVPVRFFEKALKAEIEWEPTTGRIYVAMTP